MSLADPLAGGELAAFVTAVESGTVQGAADALQLTQSAATKRIQALERAEIAVRAPGRTAVPLRIHASRTIGETLLPEWLASFRPVAPASLVSVVITNSEEVLRAVREGACEVGFVEGPPQGVRGLEELVVAHDEIRAVVAAGHPWARRRASGRRPRAFWEWLGGAGAGANADIVLARPSAPRGPERRRG